jgi:hypothetical protein
MPPYKTSLAEAAVAQQAKAKMANRIVNLVFIRMSPSLVKLDGSLDYLS